MEAIVTTSKNFVEYQNAIDQKFAELEKEAAEKINSLSKEDLEEYKTVIQDQRLFLKTKISAYNSIKSGSPIEKEFWNKNVKPYLISFGISPVEKEETVEYKNAKGELVSKVVVKMVNNMKDGWKSGDKDLAIIDILSCAQIPTILRSSLNEGILTKETTGKYKAYIDAAGKEAKYDFNIRTLTVNKHVFKLKKNMALANFKLTLINERNNNLKLTEAQNKKVQSESALNTLCKSSVRYQNSTSLLAKKYCIQ